MIVNISLAGRNNNFNFLRLFFASLVLVSHGVELVDGNRKREILTRIFGTVSFGELAVDGFFLLSGFLILQSWQHHPNLTSYFSKRIRRIYPGFLVAYAVSVYVLAPLGATDVTNYFTNIAWLTQMKNAFLLMTPQTPTVFLGTPYPFINGAVWTIASEFRCYILVAIVGLLGISRQKPVWVMLLSLFVGFKMVIAISPEMKIFGISSPIVYYQEQVRLLCFFSAGTCFYLFRSHVVFNRLYVMMAGILLLISMLHLNTSLIGLCTCGAYCLFFVAFVNIPILNYFKNFTDISYGVYLYGWPVQKLLTWYFPTASPWLLLAPTFALCCLAGYASWMLVEAPFMSRHRKVLVAY